MSFVIYSCKNCKVTIFAQDPETCKATELCAGLDYCQACDTAINKAFPPAAPLTPEQIREEEETAWANQNALDAYDSYMGTIASDNDTAETDPYFGRDGLA